MCREGKMHIKVNIHSFLCKSGAEKKESEDAKRSQKRKKTGRTFGSQGFRA
jgi:hypothetical protein